MSHGYIINQQIKRKIMTEIKVNIPVNDYKPVINEKNVQYICDAFLNQGSGCAFNDYAIGYDNCVRLANGTRAYGFGNTTNEPSRNEVQIRISREEVNAALEALVSAGYHVFKRTWWAGRFRRQAFYCEKAPYPRNNQAVEVYGRFF